MQVLLVTILRWLLRHLLWLVLIVAVLLLGRAGWVEWQAWQSMRAESVRLNDADRIIDASLQKQAGGLRLGSLTDQGQLEAAPT